MKLNLEIFFFHRYFKTPLASQLRTIKKIISSAVVASPPSPLAIFSSTFWQVINHSVDELTHLLFVFNIDLSPGVLKQQNLPWSKFPSRLSAQRERGDLYFAQTFGNHIGILQLDTCPSSIWAVCTNPNRNLSRNQFEGTKLVRYYFSYWHVII